MGQDRQSYDQQPPLPSLRGMSIGVGPTPAQVRTSAATQASSGGSAGRIIQQAMSSSQMSSSAPQVKILATKPALVPVRKDLGGGTASLTAISAAAKAAKAQASNKAKAKAAPPKKPRVKLLPPGQEKAIVGNLLAVLRPGLLLDAAAVTDEKQAYKAKQLAFLRGEAWSGDMATDPASQYDRHVGGALSTRLDLPEHTLDRSICVSLMRIHIPPPPSCRIDGTFIETLRWRLQVRRM